MWIGKRVRFKRITDRNKMICVPMDHGVSSGPIKGIERIYETIRKVEEGGATAIIVHKGIIRNLKDPPNLGIIVHLSGSTSLGTKPNFKVQVGSVEEAIYLGADAVSVHINIGGENEPEMLEKIGGIADACDAYGLPLVAMMYARGRNIKDPYNPSTVAHVTRIGGELGADIVKTTYTGNPETFRKVVESSPVPVVIAGGPKMETEREVFEMVEGAMEAGAIGVTFGRNVFQHEKPEAMLKALRTIIMDKTGVDEALEVFKNESKR